MIINYRKKLSSKYSFAFLFLIMLLALACVEKKVKADENPLGYDLTKPKKYSMPDLLQEISGIAFNNGDSSIVYAQQDEDGDVFRLPIGTKDKTATKFAGKGDYEDIAVAKGWIIMLKSNGNLYSFSINETAKEEAANVIDSKNLLPKGEYEGMFADEATGKVYVLCKTCKQDKGTKNASGYILTLQSNGSLKQTGNFTVNASEMDKLAGKKKGSFHPSALALHPITKEWYIVSSVNKALIIADQNFKIKSVHHLSSNIFNQPEGLAFDKDGNMYISNEGSETTSGNILKFVYQPKPTK